MSARVERLLEIHYRWLSACDRHDKKLAEVIDSNWKVLFDMLTRKERNEYYAETNKPYERNT